MANKSKDIHGVLLVTLLDKGFEHDEINFFLDGYGRYFESGVATLIEYVYKNPNSTKEDVIDAARRIQGFCWKKDVDETEIKIREICKERGYSLELLVEASMRLAIMYKNCLPVLEMFETITNERELALKIINCIEEYTASREKRRRFEDTIKAFKSKLPSNEYDECLLEDLDLVLNFAYHRNFPMQYEKIIEILEFSTDKEDFLKKFNPIFEEVSKEMGLHG